MEQPTPQDAARMLMGTEFESLTTAEQQTMKRITQARRLTVNVNEVFEDELTFGQRIADKVASFGGSWTFIITFGVILLTWVVLNSIVLARARSGGAFDPYPYILLNLFLSMLAALQAPVIMMSQNRQAAKDRLDAQHDYEINLKAELEIQALHEKMDQLREGQWADLVMMQQAQIKLLTQLLSQRVGGSDPPA
jgi:uncharacterized membrane protein